MSASNTISDSCRLTSPASTWPLAATPSSKLRDSCHACAVSKVKCHREKPSCSRCVKRGTVCAYVTTRRGGRKKPVATQKDAISGGKASPYPVTVNTNHPSQPSPLACSAESTATNLEFMQPERPDSHPSPPLDISTDLNFTLFTNLFGSEEQSLSPLLTDLLTDSGSFDVSFNVPEPSAADVFSDASLFGTSTVEGSSTVPDTANKEFALATTALNRRGNAVATSDGEYGCWQDSQSEEKSCSSCLARALGLMQSLSPNDTTSGDGTPPTVQSVIQNNKQVLEAASAMMKCSCSEDGYVLAITSLIISKVLGWYYTAARKMSIAPNNHNKSTSSSSWPTPRSNKSQETPGYAVAADYCLDGEDQDRMKAQLVLGELHRVQSLVNQLGTKLKLLAEKKRGGTTTSDGYMEGEKMPSISAMVVDQVGTDLRNRLQWLSKHIIQRLNRE
ncbi:hypothetical protein M434DRAFT_9729 [Hypoxylon sp. CO27-5]|nr:hypothetical protein M434DRAFT_9729 [Hypoxylon sp. CO27-5]